MTCLGYNLCQFHSIAALPVYVRQTAVSYLTSTLGWLSEALFTPGINIYLSRAVRLDS